MACGPLLWPVCGGLVPGMGSMLTGARFSDRLWAWILSVADWEARRGLGCSHRK
jgi:hypothetical protein